MKILFTLFTVLFPPFAMLQAQSGDGAAAQQNLDKLGEDGYMGPVQTFDNRYTGVHGTPYLIETWMPGIVYFINGKEVKVTKIRYDAYTDELVAQKSPQQEIVLIKAQIKGFDLLAPGKDPLVFKKANGVKGLYPTVNDDQLVQILFEGNNAGLYAVHEKSFTKANYQGAYSAGKTYDEFSEVRNTYFVKKENGEVEEVKLRKGAILKTFDKYKKEIAALIRTQNLQFEQPVDLIKVVQLYNELIQNG